MGNDAKRAAVVAAFSNLQVGNGFPCGAITGQVFVCHKGWRLTHALHSLARFYLLQHLHNVLIIAGPHDRFCLWYRLQELVLKMLG